MSHPDAVSLGYFGYIQKGDCGRSGDRIRRRSVMYGFTADTDSNFLVLNQGAVRSATQPQWLALETLSLYQLNCVYITVIVSYRQVYEYNEDTSKPTGSHSDANLYLMCQDKMWKDRIWCLVNVNRLGNQDTVALYFPIYDATYIVAVRKKEAIFFSHLKAVLGWPPDILKKIRTVPKYRQLSCHPKFLTQKIWVFYVTGVIGNDVYTGLHTTQALCFFPNDGQLIYIFYFYFFSVAIR